MDTLALMPSTPPTGRLDLLLQTTFEEVFEPDSVSDAPLVRFIAYGRHHRIYGWIRLQADRLTDLLNAHQELRLADVEVESLEDGVTRSADEVLVRRAELVAVQAAGPRGDEARRRTTRSHPIAVQAGSYLIGGHLHAVPGDDPIASAHDRPPMFPLTDAWIEYWSDGERMLQSVGTIIVNRDQSDWIRAVTDEDLIDGQLRLSHHSGPTAKSSPGHETG
jgi:hypothetical protein